MLKITLSNGLNINYVEQNSTALTTLLFLHCNSHSSRSFFKQTESQLFNQFRLIFIDLPGHGESAKMSSYSAPLLAMAITEFIKLKNLENVLIVGHSLGGHVALHMLKFYQPKGIFLFGTPPLKKPFDPSTFLPNPHAIVLFQEESSKEQISLLMDDLNYNDKEKEINSNDYLKTDPVLRKSIFSTILSGEYEDEIELIKNFNRPIRVLITTKDTLINNKYIDQNLKEINPYLSFSHLSCGHAPQIEDANSFNSLLIEFASFIFN